MKKNFQQKREIRTIRGYEIIIQILSLLFVCFLLWISLISTSVISPDANEHTYFIKSPVLLNSFLIVLIIGSVKMVSRSRKIRKIADGFNQNDHLFRNTEVILLLALAGILSWWILMLNCQPKADQQLVLETAKHMRFGDYVDFEKYGYVSMNHQQFGIVCAEYLLSFLFGTENYLALQLLNVPGVLLCYIMMERIQKEAGCSNRIRLMTTGLCILFFPFSMYVIFVYGTIWGMALSLTSVYLEIRFFHMYQWKDLILSTVCILMAVFLKSNYLIFLIALYITAVVETVRQRKIRILLLPCMVMLLLSGEYRFSEAMIHHLAGENYAAPKSSWTWVAVGTSENDIMADGWYSDSVGRDIYLIAYGDAEMDEFLTRQIVDTNLKIYRNNPRRFLRFLLNKTASQWNNPTFQGFWIVQRAPHVQTKLTQDPIVKNTYQYLKAIQIFILTGALLNLILRRNRKPDELILLLIFTGGFVFHLFWEAKCQYTVVYFILLIPYAVEGYDCMSAMHNWKGKVIPLMLFLMLAGLIFPYVSDDVQVLQKDAWPVLKDEQDPWGFSS